MHKWNNVINILISEMFNKLIKMTNVIKYECIKAVVTWRRICSGKLAPFHPAWTYFMHSSKDHSLCLVYSEKVLLIWTGFKIGFISLCSSWILTKKNPYLLSVYQFFTTNVFFSSKHVSKSRWNRLHFYPENLISIPLP